MYDFLEIKAFDFQIDTGNLVVLCRVQDLSGPEQSLGWNATDIHTRSSEWQASIDHCGFGFEFVGADSCRESPRTASNYDEIELGHIVDSKTLSLLDEKCVIEANYLISFSFLTEDGNPAFVVARSSFSTLVLTGS